MPTTEKKSKKDLLLVIEDLRIQLEEAEDMLRAIRRGEVDALVVSSPQGDQVYTLKTADQPYRIFVENMNEGAVTFTADGTVVFCNTRFSGMVGKPLEKVIGSSVFQWIHPDDQAPIRRIVDSDEEGSRTAEIHLITSEETLLPVLFSLTPFNAGATALASAVVTDISERKASEEMIRSYMKALEETNKELQSFAFIASHDLQEPLRKLQVFGDLLFAKHSQSLSEEAADYIRRMQHAAERMSILIDSLLDYSRVSTKTQPFSKVDLKSVVKEALSNLEIRIRETGGLIEVGDLPRVEADRNQMVRLFQNLIGNAIKFHCEGEKPKVKIHCRYREEGAGEPGRFEIFVEDNGIGFESKYHDRIFLPFERLVRRTEYDGVGMGLAICRKIVERHGGVITAESVPGKGTTFLVSLPKLGEGHQEHIDLARDQRPKSRDQRSKGRDQRSEVRDQ